ncbi:hypothetical protein RclHR1_06130008 [Rhizophagus clarus]|uniref:Ubiquitin domain-containing protein n=1 Tax=Rhizophagus clarus TaxID=94130 RepID=A0A2Z6SHJ2_9GLOM|nr:hypothetical protein RclHR1_06130008 [Rhizophagus clarus]GES73311.1 ubiquitin domain-containing protein [Rhizophagus clarus]
MSNSLLAAALSAVTKRSVITYDDYSNSKGGYDEYVQLDQKVLHQNHLVSGRVPTSNEVAQIQLYIQGFDDRTVTYNVEPNEQIHRLKSRIRDRMGIPLEAIRLLFAGRTLEDNYTLAHYKITSRSTIHLILRLQGGGDPSPTTALFIDPNSLDPSYDYDFTHIDDKGITFTRGNFEYKRPCGWKRIAINVLNKYSDNIWLGVNRESSTNSAQNEWPVSYHGTAIHNCKDIAEEGYDLCKGKRFAFGHGIYSTPDIDVAYSFAIKFTHEGDDYRVVFQNRVNPNSLIRVSKEETKVGEYWISPNDKDVRPYGICIKKEN